MRGHIISVAVVVFVVAISCEEPCQKLGVGFRGQVRYKPLDFADEFRLVTPSIALTTGISGSCVKADR